MTKQRERAALFEDNRRTENDSDLSFHVDE